MAKCWCFGFFFHSQIVTAARTLLKSTARPVKSLKFSCTIGKPWRHSVQKYLEIKSYQFTDHRICPRCYQWQAAHYRAGRVPREIRAVVAYSHLWFLRPIGIKDAALPRVDNVWLHIDAIIWTDNETQCFFKEVFVHKSPCTAGAWV